MGCDFKGDMTRIIMTRSLRHIMSPETFEDTGGAGAKGKENVAPA